MRQLQLLSPAELAPMRDRTASRNHSPERDEFRREHKRPRDRGLSRRYATKTAPETTPARRRQAPPGRRRNGLPPKRPLTIPPCRPTRSHARAGPARTSRNPTGREGAGKCTDTAAQTTTLDSTRQMHPARPTGAANQCTSQATAVNCRSARYLAAVSGTALIRDWGRPWRYFTEQN
jgi:hypothetical protein